MSHPLDHVWDGDLCLHCGAQAIVPIEAEPPCPGLELYAYDTETHLIQPGLAAPPMVVASVANVTPGSERLLPKADGLATFRQLLHAGNARVGGANLAYDLGVVSVEDPSFVDLIFAALEDGRLLDTHVLEKLHAIGKGTLDTYSKISLAELEKLYLGIDRTEEKENGWRLRYAELEHVPIEQWPDDAVQYPRRDARGTLDVLLRQLGLTGASRLKATSGRCAARSAAQPRPTGATAPWASRPSG
jgi:DNA polymerase-1